MKRSITFLITVLFWNNLSFAQTLPVDTITIKTEASVISATFYNGYFYYLDENHRIFKTNAERDREEIYNAGREFTHITNVNGKLIGLETLFKPNKYNTFTEYHYNGKTFKKKGRIDEIRQELYEDDSYKITSACHGEWGGKVYFKNKRSGKTYQYQATCPIVINNIGKSYYVTAALAHMVGFTEVIRIDNPESLKLHEKEWKSETEKDTLKEGNSVLVDSVGIQAITSFLHKGELYHILTKFYDLSRNLPVSYLAKIENGKFEKVQNISDHVLWRSDYHREVSYKDGFLLSVSDGDSNENLLIGFDGTKIIVVRFEKEE
ncbi:hypothetical protein [Prevotella sp. 10(H)]|uniref:hypothetical protein n=1 Tax=Prevotella sp. 10(H) TaxID=1158294 RepID=UPI0004A6ABBE|nr:hypothetical protein [Prevotella sp. 10(H)]